MGGAVWSEALAIGDAADGGRCGQVRDQCASSPGEGTPDTVTPMSRATIDPDPIGIHAHAYPQWSITLPTDLWTAVCSIETGWHARDDHRSVSLSSIGLTERGRPIPADRIAAQIGTGFLPRGQTVPDQPDGLAARAVFAPVVPPTVASRALMGVVMADGWLLVTTITADDEAWCRRVWRSIKHHPDGPAVHPSVRGRRHDPALARR
jgi:hypothetical protein